MKDLFHGFRLEETRENLETSSSVHYYRHEKSGAPLLYLENDSQNKTFGIGFRTPPEDSTGVAHIVEHCVLSGSRKFRTKEPFMDLLKTSMQTFLNAMTFSDMTIYPVSSKNDKDFYQLTDVYMDAVFHPLMLENPFVFYQEGWHHELLNPEDEIIYKGVVYNEMRGAYSSAEGQIIDQIVSNLHPGGTYSHDSGGNPYEIPKLSLDQFKAFHQKHYHPSNALLFLHGKVNLEELLPLLDDYLNDFNRESLDIEIDFSPGFTLIQDKRFEYNASSESDSKEDSYMSYSVSMGDSTDIEQYLAREILYEILIRSQSSPVKKALFDRDLGQDLIGLYNQTAGLDFGFILKGADEKNLPEFILTLEETLRSMVEKGIDPALLEASLNRVTLTLKEAGGEHKGIEYFIQAMEAFTAGKDPLTLLEYQPVLERIKEESKNCYFEHLIEEKILNNNHKLIGLHLPNPDYYKHKDEQLKEELKQYKESLTKEEVDELIQLNEALIDFQNKEDTKEEKDSIPKLSLDDIKHKLEPIEKKVIKEEDFFVIGVPQSTSGITYMNISFDLAHLSDEERIYVSYLSKLLGISSTRKYLYDELNNEIFKKSAGLTLSPDAYRGKEDETRVTLYLNAKALHENLGGLLSLTEHVLEDTLFEKKRIKEVLQMMKSNFEMRASQAGHALTRNRLKSYFNQVALIDDELKGIGLYDHLNEILANWEDRAQDFIEKLEQVYLKLIASQGAVAVVTAEPSDLEEAMAQLKTFLGKLPANQGDAQEIGLVPKKKNEGITAPFNVQYVSKGLNFKELGYEYSGKLAVLSQYLSTDFLHNEIRAKGGAYGAGIGFERSGDITTFSYRDPNLKKTIDVYDSLEEHFRDFSMSQEDLQSIIIGTASKFDPLLSPASIGPYVLLQFLTGLTTETLEKNLNEALETTAEDFKNYTGLFRYLKELNYLCVIGNKETVEENADVFQNIRPLNVEDSKA